MSTTTMTSINTAQHIVQSLNLPVRADEDNKDNLIEQKAVDELREIETRVARQAYGERSLSLVAGSFFPSAKSEAGSDSLEWNVTNPDSPLNISLLFPSNKSETHDSSPEFSRSNSDFIMSIFLPATSTVDSPEDNEITLRSRSIPSYSIMSIFSPARSEINSPDNYEIIVRNRSIPSYYHFFPPNMSDTDSYGSSTPNQLSIPSLYFPPNKSETINSSLGSNEISLDERILGGIEKMDKFIQAAVETFQSNNVVELMFRCEAEIGDGAVIGESKRSGLGLGQWMKRQLGRTPSVTASSMGYNNNSSSSSSRRCDLRLLLGVMGAPLAPRHVSTTDPLPHLRIKDTPIETSSAQYILQQYTAASGGQKLQNSIKNTYAMGKLRMVASEFEIATKEVKNRSLSRYAESGGFELLQMNPDMWYLELAVGGSKVHAGCNGKLVWRQTPWLSAHTAKGPVRPLRRALQGLDPRTTAVMFADARCTGEKKINGEDCFILKLCVDPLTLKWRSAGPAEIIRHVLLGYFSQKTGLLVYLEDSHLLRIQSNGGDSVYWETTINSFLDDYRSVEGIMIAHSGRSLVTLFRFGEVAMSNAKTKMEEAWTIEEVAFNVPGLSVDCFIPQADLRSGSISETCELPQDERGKGAIALAGSSTSGQSSCTGERI